MLNYIRKLRGRSPIQDEDSPLMYDSDGAVVSPRLPYVNVLQPSMNAVDSDRDEMEHSTSSLMDSSVISRRRRAVSGSSTESEAVTEFDTGTSNFQTMMHLFKGSVGTGILGLPLAICHAGIIVGPICLFVIAIVTIHCMHLIVESSHALCKRLNRDAMSYSDVAEESTRPYINGKSYYARTITNIFLLTTQFGFCSVYFLFIADNIAEVAELTIDIRIIVAALALPVILLSFVRSLEKLAYLSFAANVCCILGLIAIFQFLFRNLHDPHRLPKFGGWARFPLFLSTTLFAFEGIGVVLPLENDMRHPEDFGWVMNVGMGVVTLLFVAMGSVGYIAFGSSIQDVIILNLPDNVLYDFVKMGFAFAMFCTYFLQFYVPMQITLPTVLRNVTPKWKRCVECLYRTAMVLMTCGLAIGIPQMGNFISLIGAFSSSGLAVIFPPLFHILTFYKNGLSVLGCIKNCLIIAFGFLGFLFGTYTSVLAIIVGFEKHHNATDTNSTHHFNGSSSLLWQSHLTTVP